MTTDTTADEQAVPLDDLAPIHDPATLRDAGVPFHRDTDTVGADTFDAVDAMDDMAPVGVTTADGAVLVMRVTDDCEWKIPAPEVGDGASYDEAARSWVAEQAALPITLDGVAGVWRLEVTLDETEADEEATDESDERDETEADGGDETETDHGATSDDRTAVRNFVVFTASPTSDADGHLDADSHPDVSTGDATAAQWTTTLPDGAEEPPGTDLFFD